ncbi:aspartate aminotransferase family protein [Aestuariirhabdus sp. LZHN29]|uniref:aspartate aminotransferase family protein n=1 Tax=Aestuariirhabdus sp. LZHN29 TaxID=3417462 RepID=UPI003CEC2799
MNDKTNSLDAFWMPFTANRQFKASPRILTEAKGMYYKTDDGREILDGTAGLWCCNAGHSREQITEAVSAQIAKLDYAPPFQMGHPMPFELAERLVQHSPEGLDHVFFTNSGSESVDTALKIAIAYHRLRGQGTRQRLVGREKGYHGVGFGGISVGGLVNNRKFFGSLLNGVDHLPHTLNIKANAFTKGLPENGAELADELENIVALHDASTIAAVIVEPFAGSAGVIMPPQGYLQRLRDICTKHGILLIFDEVITGYGRIGDAFAANRFGVKPDMITTAKGLTNGAIPMGAVFVSDDIYNTFMDGPEGIELFHGYTYSGHPVAAAAGLATLDIYEQDGLFARGLELESYWQETMHSLQGAPNIIDIRSLGLVAGIEFAPSADGAGKRGYEVFLRCFEKGVLVRATGDIIAVSPPLIIEKAQIDRIAEAISEAARSVS